MAGPKDVITQQLQSGAGLLDMFSKDLTEEDALYQPTEGGCHLRWILGHLAVTQDWAVARITGQAQRLSERTHELFRGGSNVSADAPVYPSRTELEEMFRITQETTIAALDKFDIGRWDEAAPEGVPKDFFPTLGAFWGMLPLHTLWHVGQLTINRRMLDKPYVMT